MGQIVGPETLSFNLNQMPGNYPKEDNLNGESLKFNVLTMLSNLSLRTATHFGHVQPSLDYQYSSLK
jgi:hypothetical protein